MLIEGVALVKDNLSRFLSGDRYSLPPLHNFFFTRDAGVAVWNKVLIARMANEIDGVQYIKLEDYPVLAKMSRIQQLAPDSIGIFGGLGGVYFLEELQRGSRGIMTGREARKVGVGGEVLCSVW